MKLIPKIEINKIEEDVFQIVMNGHVYSYLVIGREKALVVDTGWGMADLKRRIEAITNLPLIVINTHGHLDHVYGNHQFDQIFIRDEDKQMMVHDYLPESRAKILQGYDSSKLLDGITEQQWIGAKLGVISSLNGLDHVDLGGRRIDILHTPGHTRGSVCLLDRGRRMIFTGDTIYKGYILLHFNLSASLSEYSNSLKKIAILNGDGGNFDYIMPAHGKTKVEASFLERVIDGVDEIISGRITGQAGEFYSRPAMTCGFGEYYIVYRENNIV